VKKILVFLMIATLLSLSWSSVFAEAEGTNLIPNPSFEDGSGGEVYFWAKNCWDNNGGVTEFKWDDTQSHSGKKSACIINNSPNDSRYKQQVKVDSNSYYKLSCWAKSENVGAEKKGANLSVEGIIDTSNEIKGATESWQYLELYGKTSETQQNFVLTLGLGGYGSLNTGKAWFDDVVVEKLNAAPPDKNVVNLFATGTGSTSTGGDSSNSNSWLIIAAIFVVFLGAVIFFIARSKKAPVIDTPPGKTIVKASPMEPVAETKIFKLQLDRKDLIIMAAMTLVYLAIALFNLGSFKVPETLWKPIKPGENFTISLGKQANVSRISYFNGLGDGRYRLEYLDNTGKFVPLTTIDKRDFYVWKYVTVAVQTSQIRIITDVAGGTLNELGIFEQGSKTPLNGIKIIDKAVDPGDTGTVENLFDEPDTIDFNPSFMSGTYFDEIYHVRTAYEHLHQIEPYETTHPPLGKILIALGILLFGMNTFGWRIMGTLFGTAMIPAMYLFGKKLFEKRFYAFCAAFLMMFDFMHFTQTRIGTIDVYGTFFVILMYYFMSDYYINKSYVLGYSKSLRPLFWTGLFFGIGVACKWIAIYGAAGLALMFIMAKYSEYKEYNAQMATNKKGRKKPWVHDFVPLYIWGTIFSCILFFIIIPGIIYILSYIPFMMVPGPGHGLYEVYTYQGHMYNYHKNLVATHSFSSPWWSWPIDLKPIWFYGGTELTPGKTSSIVSMGNPAIWWVGIISMIAAISIAFKKSDRKASIFFIALAFQYLPWALISRLTFIYHFFSSVPFMILAIVYVIKHLLDTYPEAKPAIYLYLGVVAILFIMFYPVLSGMEVDKTYVDQYLRWFKNNWIF
jgi:dolichyl-phosphate-mannose-protein mannosyltransferase